MAFEMGVKIFFNEIQLTGGANCKPLKYILTRLLLVTLGLAPAFSWPWALPWGPTVKIYFNFNGLQLAADLEVCTANFFLDITEI